VKLRFLGTGTSFGVPVIGCDCAVCTSDDPRDRRTRHSVVLEGDGDAGILLVDTPPEMRLQLVGAGIRRIDAVWITHYHADHTHGVDDLRTFSARMKAPVEVHASEACLAELGNRFPYIFDPTAEPLVGVSRPDVRSRVLRPYEPVEIAGFPLLPLPVPHGTVRPLGFRTGDLGYITDAKNLPERTFEALRGVRTLVLNALWFGTPHPTHFTMEEAAQVAADLGAERTYITHISHRAGHREMLERLPAGVEPAYDGLVVEI
jgi:phosphoribosyl 1,2-cyclic phosphate phosphodiesterase